MQLTAGISEGVLGFSPHSVFWVQMLKKGRNKDTSSVNVSILIFFFFFDIGVQTNLASAFVFFAFNGELMRDVNIICSFYQFLLWEKVGSHAFPPFKMLYARWLCPICLPAPLEPIDSAQFTEDLNSQ